MQSRRRGGTGRSFTWTTGASDMGWLAGDELGHAPRVIRAALLTVFLAHDLYKLLTRSS